MQGIRVISVAQGHRLLAILLDITESGYGFVGEVVGEGDGVNPWLRTWAMTDISWDAQSRALYEQSGQEGVMEFVNTELIFASVLNSHKPVIANAAKSSTVRKENSCDSANQATAIAESALTAKIIRTGVYDLSSLSFSNPVNRARRSS